MGIFNISSFSLHIHDYSQHLRLSTKFSWLWPHLAFWCVTVSNFICHLLSPDFRRLWQTSVMPYPNPVTVHQQLAFGWPASKEAMLMKIINWFKFLVIFIKSVFSHLCDLFLWFSCDIVLRSMSLDLTNNESTSVQVIAWCHQATSHYLSQCWPRSVSPYSVPRPQ